MNGNVEKKIDVLFIFFMKRKKIKGNQKYN